jgi:hypothetical protein
LPSLLHREPGNNHRGHPIPWTGKQAIKAPPPQSPTRFSITPLISTSNWTHIPLSYCQTPGSMAGRRSCFTKQRRPAVAFHTIVRRRTRCIPTSDQALCPVGISRGKAASKADSAPPMSHSSRALLGMYCLVQGQSCRVLRLPLYITKRQLGAFFASYIYIRYTKFCAINYSHCFINVQKVLLRFSFLLFSLSLTILTP